MILGFKTQFAGKPTLFVEKIKVKEKIHTIRKDPNNRWRVGMSIQFATGVRTKHYRQFKVGDCKGLQSISIRPMPCDIFGQSRVIVDGNDLSYQQIEQLAKNDGFDSLNDFWDWFNKDFDGWIIHWSDFKY